MDTQILLGLFLTVLPFIELRGGLPVIVDYCVKNNFSVWPYFLVVLIFNILIIFLIFMFFDFVHDLFLEWKWYRKFIGGVLRRIRGKVSKIRVRMDRWGYFALMLAVAVPLPGTGAWSGALVAWTMGLNRLRSFAAISVGVIIAGLIILLLSLGFFGGFY